MLRPDEAPKKGRRSRGRGRKRRDDSGGDDGTLPQSGPGEAG